MAEISVGLVLVLVIGIFVACFACGGIDQFFCKLRGGHDWEWQHNHQLTQMSYSKRPGPLVGRYSCRNCHEWSNGCARYEQQTRTIENEVEPPPSIRGHGQANFMPFDRT